MLHRAPAGQSYGATAQNNQREVGVDKETKEQREREAEERLERKKIRQEEREERKRDREKTLGQEESSP